MQKPVLFVALLNLLALLVAGGEGSGQLLAQLDDMEDDLDDFDGFDGSGDDWDTLRPVAEDSDAAEYDISFSNLESLEDMESLEYYEYMDQYNDDEYAYMDTVASTDSVLKIEDVTHNDIEIRLKPEAEQAEEILLETSQIFIMVGSAFVSFAIFMLAFFLCRRMVATKKEKQQIPFSVAPERRVLKESNIVKDYEKVPTTTKQFLQHPHTDLYRGEPCKHDNPASAPLVE